jgi:tRNA (5-methylaminomethyl-2-thiouridylate)-methyltransferase
MNQQLISHIIRINNSSFYSTREQYEVGFFRPSHKFRIYNIYGKLKKKVAKRITMITTSITPRTVQLRKSRLFSSLFLASLLSHTIIFLLPRTSWFRSSNDNTSSIFGVISTCHSFTMKHQWSATLPSSRRTVQTETRRKFATIFSEPNDGDNGGNFCENSFSNASIEEIQHGLVEKGFSFKQSSLEEEPSMTRVPGCVSTVYVVAKQENGVDNGKTTTDRISLYGNSDAMLSRGLLSLLKEYLEQLTLVQILQLEPMNVADVLGVRPALSKGRNDGLANMMNIIQKQLKSDNDQAEETSTTELTSSTIASSSSSVDKKPTVALLLSGGVDSSVAFRLLLEEGYDVTPFYLKIWLEDELTHLGECPWEDDINTCHQVCDQVGIDLQTISLQAEYHQRVMQHTLNEASLGRTPNPDILCNSRVKFGCFLEYLKGLPNQFDYIASGHYAQVKRTTSNIDDDDNGVGVGGKSTCIAKLFRAPDPVKDQSYFLCALDQSQLSRLLFPIGHLEKTEVRQLADDFQLPNRHRPDSQGLCFLGKVKFRDFMEINLGKKDGDLVDAVTGEIIGTHHGVWYHTVGQRKGIGPYLVPKATAKGPWYVVAKVRTKTGFAI